MPTMSSVHFQRQCAEALVCYARVFGGTIVEDCKPALFSPGFGMGIGKIGTQWISGLPQT